MLLKYDDNAINAYLMVGLLETPNITEEQRDELTIIADLVDGLRKTYLEFCASKGARSSKDLMDKAKEDEQLAKDIKDWVTNVLSKKQETIKKMVDKFNRTHVPGYATAINP